MPANTNKPKASDRGQIKIAIFFIDHKLPTGRAFTMHSNRSQDNRNLAVNRFKRMVSIGKFSGTVNWAGIYQNEWLIAEYKEKEDGKREWAHRDGRTQNHRDLPDYMRKLDKEKQMRDEILKAGLNLDDHFYDDGV